MCLSAARLEKLLWPRPIQFFPQIDSTQTVALQWLHSDAMAGAVVIADEQLAGRGRLGRIWSTPPGVALALSVILRPEAKALPQVTMLGAVAVAELLESLGACVVTIKWPNDVRLLGRKVGGVLPEAIWDGNRLGGVTLGIGVNVRNDFTNTELAGLAISAEATLGRRLDRAELLAALLARVDYWAARLGTTDLFTAWKTRLETLGQAVKVVSFTGTVSGIAESVDEQGVLILNDNGTRRPVIAGDVL